MGNICTSLRNVLNNVTINKMHCRNKSKVIHFRRSTMFKKWVSEWDGNDRFMATRLIKTKSFEVESKRRVITSNETTCASLSLKLADPDQES